MAHDYPWDDVPPPDEPLEEIPDGDLDGAAPDGAAVLGAPPGHHPADIPPTRASSARPRARQVDETIVSPDLVLTTIRSVIAASHGENPELLYSLVETIRDAKQVLSLLSDRQRQRVEETLSALAFTASNMEGGSVDLTDIPIVSQFGAYSDDVLDELGRIGAQLDVKLDGDPLTAWHALAETAQRAAAAASYRSALDAIEAKATPERLIEIHRTLEIPTIKRAARNNTHGRSARDWDVELKLAEESAPLRRYSSGYRSLDLANTAPGEMLGWISAGDFSIKAAGTGQGKSSDASIAVPAAAQDMVNQGDTDAYVVLMHTEEEVSTKMAQMQLRDGMRNAHLADNVWITKVGTTLQRCALTLYDITIEAVTKAHGDDVRPYLPRVVYVDYIQALKADPSQNEAEAVAQAANFFLYGVAAWDFEEMSRYSGVDFRTYAGMPLPDGMENHRVAVVSYAQLRKQDGGKQFYRAGAKMDLGEFAVENHLGDPGWEVRPGDLRIPTQDEIRGSGVLLQHATNLIFLHRSTPDQPIVREPGRPPRLADRRARFILSKTRNGKDVPFVPMEFSSNPNPGTNKGQYFDVFAERAIAEGRFTPDSSYRQTGDFIIPRRADLDPLSGISY